MWDCTAADFGRVQLNTGGSQFIFHCLGRCEYSIRTQLGIKSAAQTTSVPPKEHVFSTFLLMNSDVVRWVWKREMAFSRTLVGHKQLKQSSLA